MPVEIAIIVALEREVRPLVRHWARQELVAGEFSFPAFSRDSVLVVCCGIGSEFARRAVVAIFASHRPRVVVSAGLAGALDGSLRVGEIFQPAIIVDAASGARFSTTGGQGVLVSATSVLGREGKRRITGSFTAAAADMEAAAVALVADQHGCPFIAIKAISDESGFDMPSFDGFIDARGHIRTMRLLLSSVSRPSQWPAWLQLRRNTARATQQLCQALAHLIRERGAALEPVLSGKRS